MDHPSRSGIISAAVIVRAAWIISRKVLFGAVRPMSELGNFSPAISVEGFEQETDSRRGKGINKKILEAMDNLRRLGVLFGISVDSRRKSEF